MKFTMEILKELTCGFLLFPVIIFSMSFFYTYTLQLAGFMIIVFLLVYKFYRKPNDLIFYVIGIIVGSVGEIIITYFGVWSYTMPDFMGIPFWLPFAWGLSMVAVKRFADIVIKIFK